MHTMLVMSGGLALLIACLVAGRSMGNPARGALMFLPLWLGASALNMWIGVTRAGYPASAELPIFLLVFGAPAVVALLAWRWLK